MIALDTHLILKIDTKKPVDLDDFVAAFVGLGSQYERFQNSYASGDDDKTRFLIREVRAGSIIAELVPYLVVASPIIAGTLTAVKHANDLASFVKNFGGGVSKYFKADGRDKQASKGDLADYLKAVQAVAHDPDGSLKLALYEDGNQRVAFEFNTAEARTAEKEILEHRSELEKTTEADHERVMMVFTRTNVEHAATGKRSGELVQIETIQKRALPIVYASALAEQRIRHEVADADENVYKKGFDVDVNVEMRGGKPIAYRLVAVHDVIDLPED